MPARKNQENSSIQGTLQFLPLNKLYIQFARNARGSAGPRAQRSDAPIAPSVFAVGYKSLGCVAEFSSSASHNRLCNSQRALPRWPSHPSCCGMSKERHQALVCQWLWCCCACINVVAFMMIVIEIDVQKGVTRTYRHSIHVHSRTTTSSST